MLTLLFCFETKLPLVLDEDLIVLLEQASVSAIIVFHISENHLSSRTIIHKNKFKKYREMILLTS